MNLKRRRCAMHWIGFVLAFSLPLCGLAAENGPSQDTKPVEITIYHTNDIHGWIMSRPDAESKNNHGGLVGGMAALANVVRKDKSPHLLIDAGDWFQGTPEGSLTQGRSAVECFNALNYDAVAIGNHEFDYGEKRLQELIGQMKMPVLGANIYEDKTHQRVPYVKPYIIKEIGGIKVGIFGLLTVHMQELVFPSQIAGLSFHRETEEAKRLVAELQSQGVTVIIAVTHVGLEGPEKAPFEGDKFLAAQVPGIDLIVGGHSHTTIEKGVVDPVNNVLIVQTGKYLTRVGKVVLDVDPRTKKVAHSQAQLIDLRIDETGEAPDIAGIVQKYKEEVGKEMEVVVGTATERLTRDMWHESALGDWMTDCIGANTHADIAIQNAGGIRSDLPAGAVTRRRIFEIMPFDNYLVTMKLTGRQVREVLEYGVSRKVTMIQVSGVRLNYRPKAESDHRLTAVSLGQKPVQDFENYTVATNDFLVSGGDGYRTFAQGADKVKSQVLLRDVLEWCARERGPVRSVPLNRIIEEN